MQIITKSTSPTRVVKRLKRFKVVSFDIFDTLISRTVPHPHDVFSVVERDFSHRYPEDSVKGFREARVLAEDRVRAERDYKEVTFDIIYTELSKIYGADVSQKMADLELSVELQLSIRKPIGFDIFNEVKDAGLKVILTSDMYLPKDFIAKLLDKNGITGYSELFVSAELDCMKSDGTLYDLIYKRLGISAKEMIHLGDNLKSDYLRPMRKGGSSYWLPKPRNEGELKDAFCLKKFLSSKRNEGTIEEDIGYNKLGPLLFGFSHWMRQKAKDEGVGRLLFLSRDGKLMQEAFQHVNIDKIENDYLYVSRQVLIQPILWMHPDLEEVEKYASISEKSDIGSVLERFGLRDTLDESLLKKHSLNFDDEIDGTKLSESEAFVALYEDIRPQVIHKSKESYDALIPYLKGFNLSGKVGIVDIGWNGSMQRALTMVLKSAQIDVEVIGFYFGVNPTSKHVAQNTASYNGYLFDHNRNLDNFVKEECFRNIFETLFLAQHGSVRAIHSNGEIEMYAYEYENIQESIYKLQQSGLQFVKDYAETVGPSFIDPSQKCYHEAVFNMGLMPTKAEAKYFGDMTFFDVGLEYIAKVQGTNVLRELSKSKWKIGYSVNFTRLRLPYHLIMQWKIKRRMKSALFNLCLALSVFEDGPYLVSLERILMI